MLPVYVKRGWIKLFFILIIIIAVSCRKQQSASPAVEIPARLQPHILKKVSTDITNTIGGYYAGLPSTYSTNSEKYPLFLFIHGLGQMGNGREDLDLLGSDGIGKFLVQKSFPESFNHNGKSYSFIILSPQYKQQPSVNEIMKFIQYAISTYRIDEKRIYISGLSSGSQLATMVAGQHADKFAAVIGMGGVIRATDLMPNCERMVAAKLPVWIFHMEDDPMVTVQDAKNFVAAYNSLNPVLPARLTLFPGFGHDAWTDALDPNYKEQGKNIYEWLLQFSR